MGSDKTESTSEPISRRRWFSHASATAMAAGLTAGYGMFVALAGRFLFPSGTNKAWMFVSRADNIAPGGSLQYQAPSGLGVVITRQSDSDVAVAPEVDDYLALSSVCPHLGCRVSWEAQNSRFFCPCHNGTFDQQGNPTGGPPKSANQALPTYPLKIEGGLLYIEMLVESIGSDGREYLVREFTVDQNRSRMI